MKTSEIWMLSDEGARVYLSRLMKALDNIDDCATPGDDPFGCPWRDYVLGGSDQ